MLFTLQWAFAVALLISRADADVSALANGKIVFEAFMNATNSKHNALHVELWQYKRDAAGELMPLLKRDIYRADDQAPAVEMLFDVPIPGNGTILTISGVDTTDNASYALLAYTCRRENAAAPEQTSHCRLRLGAGPVPLGWARDAATCFGAATGSQVCATPLQATNHGTATAPAARVFLTSPTPFDTAPRTHRFGRAWTTPSGRRVLRVGGTARQRGEAHGYLAAQQVMDVLRFFLLEDRALRGPGRGVKDYENVTLRTLKAQSLFRTPPAVLEEAQGIIDGVRSAGVLLTLPELGGRDATKWDIVALSAYGQLFVLNPRPDNANRDLNSCSQFVQEAPNYLARQTAITAQGSGTHTADADADPDPDPHEDQYPIHARNMDGEVDIRKVTVSHVLIFAVDRDPSDDASLRFVSVMWPGFIGTFSAMNEKGSTLQVNFGCPRAGASAAAPNGGYSVDTQVVRDFVSHADNLGPDAALNFLHRRHTSTTGGVIVQGILVFARAAANQSAFLYEGDSFGGELRMPGNSSVRPNVPGLIMATNHFHKYRVDERNARALTEGAGDLRCNGAPVSFSSLWRYKAGMGYVYALSRHKRGEALNQVEMRGALSAVAEGYTEHSILFMPRARRLAIAVANLSSAMWDAPSEVFEDFEFDDLFD